MASRSALLMSVAIGLAAPAARAEAPLAVRIITVAPSVDQRHLILTGEIAARHVLSASFATSGRISELPVGQGDRVKAGTVLARLDSIAQQQALRSAQAALTSARANESKARDDANRQDGLLEQGATTRSARDAAADALRAAEAQVAQARADLDSAQKSLDDTVLTAPQDATITRKSAEVGQVVGAAQPVLELALGDKYDAIFQVPEVFLTVLPDKPVTVALSPVDRPGATIAGTPRIISPLVDPTKGTVKVTVSMPDLPPGMHIGDPILGTVAVADAPHVMLPWQAISATAKGPAVWVVDPATHRVALRQVEVLRYETGRIVLAGGLKDGEEVVGAGASLLYPGREVVAAPGESQ